MDIVKSIICGALAAGLLIFPDSAGAKHVEEHVYIVPAGDVDVKILKYLKEKLPASLPMSVNIRIDRRQELPESAYYPSQGQYDAAAVMKDIAGRITIDVRNEHLLLVTDTDLYMPGSDFVFGAANPGLNTCIISIGRLKDEETNRNNKLLCERAVKKASEALGSLYSLGPCKESRCVMYPSEDLCGLDKKRGTFCRSCRNAIRNHYDLPLIKFKNR